MIRNIDPKAYRMLKSRAALEERPIGAVLSDAIRHYLAGTVSLKGLKKKKGGKGLADLPVWDFGPGSEQDSEEIDQVLYGGRP